MEVFVVQDICVHVNVQFVLKINHILIEIAKDIYIILKANGITTSPTWLGIHICSYIYIFSIQDKTKYLVVKMTTNSLKLIVIPNFGYNANWKYL